MDINSIILKIRIPALFMIFGNIMLSPIIGIISAIVFKNFLLVGIGLFIICVSHCFIGTLMFLNNVAAKHGNDIASRPVILETLIKENVKIGVAFGFWASIGYWGYSLNWQQVEFLAACFIGPAVMTMLAFSEALGFNYLKAVFFDKKEPLVESK